MRGLALLGIAIAAVGHAAYWDRDRDELEELGYPPVTAVLEGRITAMPPEFFTMRADRLMGLREEGTGATADLLDLFVAAARTEGERPQRWLDELASRAGDNAELRRKLAANRATWSLRTLLDPEPNADEVGRALQHLQEFGLDPHGASPSPERAEAALAALHMAWLASRETFEEVYEAALPSSADLAALLTVVPEYGDLTHVWWMLSDALDKEGETRDAFRALVMARETYERTDRAVYFEPTMARLERLKAVLAEPDWEGERLTFMDIRAQTAAAGAERTAYATAKLAEGRHPDLDSEFWFAYRPYPTPTPEQIERRGQILPAGFLVALAGGAVVTLGVVFWLAGRRK